MSYLNITKERVIMVVNSKDRLNPATETSSNFTWSINEDLNRISEIIIKNVQIPFSYYVFTAMNNTFIINATTITIPPGNYTASSIIPTLVAEIDGAIGGNTAITFSTSTLKLTIQNDNPIQILADDPGVNDSPASTLLGFRTDSATATTLVGDSAINFSGTDYIRVVSTFMSEPLFHKTLYVDDTYQTTLFAVPVNTSPGDIINIIPDIPLRLSRKVVYRDTDIIDFSLLDENGNILDLNGLDWSVQFVLITE